MKFSVVGLPHYTVWHLYEPSVDDIRHMEEMEQERKNREREEKERADRMKKIKDEFNDPNSQWEKDKTDLENIAQKEEEISKKESSAAVDDRQATATPSAEEIAATSAIPGETVWALNLGHDTAQLNVPYDLAQEILKWSWRASLTATVSWYSA